MLAFQEQENQVYLPPYSYRKEHLFWQTQAKNSRPGRHTSYNQRNRAYTPGNTQNSKKTKQNRKKALHNGTSEIKLKENKTQTNWQQKANKG